MRIVLSILFISVYAVTFGQTGIASLRVFPEFYQFKCGTGRPENHASIQPEIRQFTTPLHQKDSTLSTTSVFEITANPDSYFSQNSTSNYRAALGFSMQFHSKKFYNRTSYSGGWATREGIDQTHTPFLPAHNRNEYIYNDFRTRFGFTPNKTLHLSAGIDNQFFGSGYRSLIQSDQVAPNPFAMMRVNFWKLEYGLMYQVFNENLGSNRIWKFNTTHYLSYNVSRDFNITFIETVFFQPKDSNFNRGFEVEYLNPIVFFRPQEYSIGSSDNVLLGLQSSYSFGSNMKAYFQFSLDEFVLGELKNRTRWWANKYGLQLGLRGRINRTTSYIIEGNLVRPYTYSHISAGQNIGNLGRPIGHPLGSNFAEILAVVKHRMQKIELTAFGVFQLKGYDFDSISLGGDVYKSYVSYPKEYGNTIGQGRTIRSVQLGTEVSYPISIISSRIYFAATGNYQWGETVSKLNGQLTIGIRSELFNQRKLF